MRYDGRQLTPFPTQSILVSLTPRGGKRAKKINEVNVSETPSNHVTQLLVRWKDGDEAAVGELVPVVYGELRRLAQYYLQGERPGHTLQATALVHEAYVRLIGGEAPDVHNRDHFFAVAARLMRQVLVDHARARNAAKRDGGVRLSLSDIAGMPVATDEELLALDHALEELARIDERQMKIVELRFFGGLSSEATARVLGISRATVDRDWSTARLWLHREIRKSA
jgi:RNA polymerase sigma factor (TIGR02999 family)